MSDFLADLRSYFAGEENAGEAELADARPAFEHAEYADRLDRHRRAMSEAGVDVALLSRPESMCWLHGYAARWYRHAGPPEWPALATSVVRADRDEVMLFDFGGEEELLAATSVCRDIRIYPGEALDGALAFLVRELTSAGWLDGRVGRERRGVPPDQRTGEAIEAALVAAGAAIEDATDLVDRLPHLKSPAEVERIEAAGRVLDIGLNAAVQAIAPGVTELEVWGEMMLAMAKAGGQPAALHELVASGPVFLPHAISGRRALRQGEVVYLDPCGVADRYHANAARAVWVGDPPDALAELYRRAAGGFRVFCDQARPGRRVDDVGKAMQAWSEDAGISQLPSSCGGYDLGLAFPPDWVGPWKFDFAEAAPGKVFEAGMVTNLECLFGTLLVDTIIYAADGNRVLSTIPRELLVASPRTWRRLLSSPA
jgi:Xaa-Pro dipeptidase